MKRSCKGVDLTDWRALEPYVADCVYRHYARWDFRHLLCGVGKMSRKDYATAVELHDKPLLNPAIAEISKEAARRIGERDLKLPPVHIGERVDNSSFKRRMIGRESAMQQVFDHIAVGLAEPIFKRRIVPQQASSVKERGQIYGTRMIRGWAAKDRRAGRWAKAHRQRYRPSCAYRVKTDIKDCYGSARYETFIRLFKRDCGNADLLWLWEELLKSHRVDGYKGFMIGALVSQWAMQYMMSFTYRHVTALYITRRGKRLKPVSHAVIYMDDMLLFGSSRKGLLKAVRDTAAFVREELGMELKDGWSVQKFADAPSDMMGFVVHKDAGVTIRPRIFLRLRRQALRFMRTGRMAVAQARRVCSYKGYVRQAKLKIKSKKMDKKLKLDALFAAARRLISASERRRHGKDILPAGA